MLLRLHPAYFPPVSIFGMIVGSECEFAFDHSANFQKQTIRNRCEVLGANGKIRLTVPLQKWSTHVPIDQICIDNSNNWKHTHLMAIRSCYGNAPFYDHYAPELESIYTREHKFLVDLDHDSFELALRWLDIDEGRWIKNSTSSFVSNSGTEDLSAHFSKKRPILNSAQSYIQVFSDRFEFEPDLSILDLIFNLGPRSIQYLMNLEQHTDR